MNVLEFFRLCIIHLHIALYSITSRYWLFAPETLHCVVAQEDTGYLRPVPSSFDTTATGHCMTEAPIGFYQHCSNIAERVDKYRVGLSDLEGMFRATHLGVRLDGLQRV